MKTAKDPQNSNCYEKFTNDDYTRLEQVDFRSVRYKKSKMYGEDIEEVSELDSVQFDEQSQESGRKVG